MRTACQKEKEEGFHQSDLMLVCPACNECAARQEANAATQEEASHGPSSSLSSAFFAALFWTRCRRPI